MSEIIRSHNQDICSITKPKLCYCPELEIVEGSPGEWDLSEILNAGGM